MTASRKLRFRLAVFLAIEVCAGVAGAEPDEVQKGAARKLMAEGRARRETQDLKGALESFSSADAIMRVPTTAFEVARTQVELSQLLEARQTLKDLLARPSASGEPAVFARARAEAVALEDEVKQRTPELRFDVSRLEPKARARILIDGRPVPRELWERGHALNPGAHHVVFVIDGKRRERQVVLRERSVETVSFELLQSPERVRVVRLQPPPKEQETAPADLLTPAFYTMAGVSLTAAAAGVTFGLIGKTRKSELEQQCAPSCSEARIEQVQSMYTLANVSFAVSAVAAGSAIVLYTLRPDSKAEPRTGSVSLRVAADPRSPGVAVDGSF